MDAAQRLGSMKTLAHTALLLASVSVTACSGGGGGGGGNLEPCCNAQGQTDPPPGGGPAFAGGGETIEARFAQAIVLVDSASCISLGDSLLLLPDYTAVSDVVEV